ncbi:MAG: iron ABC transporter permease, partial [Proteobacteria bacterium]|nr:iron ABC transporter permease [Pseudomonadota bacterium]
MNPPTDALAGAAAATLPLGGRRAAVLGAGLLAATAALLLLGASVG